MKSYISIKFTLLVILMMAASSFGQTVTSAVDSGNDERYRIGLLDVLVIEVYRHADLNIRTTVNRQGYIQLNRLEKPIKAVCKTEDELKADIEAAYKVSYLVDPRVNVVIAEQNSQPISVIGAVEKPGRYAVQKRMHLLEILALAGGPNKEAGTRLLVARAGNSTSCRATENASSDGGIALMNFKIRDIQEGRKTLLMEPGDIVSLLSADTVYVYGNVVEPGQILVREPITLTQALAASKGYKSATDKQSVRILRQLPDSLEREDLPFNLKDIESGKAKDPYLQPNDIVAVSKDGKQAFMNGFIKAFTGGIPTLLTRGL